MALTWPQWPKNERELPIVFHENGFSIASARLIAPGSRLVGFGPTSVEHRGFDNTHIQAYIEAIGDAAHGVTALRCANAMPHPSFPPGPPRRPSWPSRTCRAWAAQSH